MLWHLPPLLLESPRTPSDPTPHRNGRTRAGEAREASAATPPTGAAGVLRLEDHRAQGAWRRGRPGPFSYWQAALPGQTPGSGGWRSPLAGSSYFWLSRKATRASS